MRATLTTAFSATKEKEETKRKKSACNSSHLKKVILRLKFGEVKINVYWCSCVLLKTA